MVSHTTFSGIRGHLEQKHTEHVDEYVLKRQQVNEMRTKERENIKIIKAKRKAQKDDEFKKLFFQKKKQKEQRSERVHLKKQERKTEKREDLEADLFDSGLSVTLTDGRKVRVGERRFSERIHRQSLFSYNYFEKITQANGDKLARCLICASKIGSRTSIYNKQIYIIYSNNGHEKHLEEVHPSIFDRFLIQKEKHKAEEELVDSILKESFTIGEPVPGFDIHKSFFFTHNYYRKIKTGPESKALCLICLRSPERKIVFLRCTDNNIQGKRILNFREGNFILIYRLFRPSQFKAYRVYGKDNKEKTKC